MSLKDPQNRVIYTQERATFDSYQFNAEVGGLFSRYDRYANFVLFLYVFSQPGSMLLVSVTNFPHFPTNWSMWTSKLGRRPRFQALMNMPQY